MKTQRRMRVIQMVCGISIGERNGGAELFGLRLAQALDPARFDVSVCCLWTYATATETHWQQELAQHGITLMIGGPSNDNPRIDVLNGYLSTHSYLRQARPAILNSHGEFADIVAIAHRKTFATRTLIRTSHNVREWSYAPYWRPITDRLYPLICDAEVGVSQTIVAQLDQRPFARRLKRRAYYIPNAVNPETITERRSGRDMRATLEITNETPLFGSVGRLSEQKGFPYLFDAMMLVRKILPDARLLIAGDGERAEEFRSLLRERGQDAYITLLGPRSDAIDLVASLDVFVSSSLWEGLPTVIMEAMLVGTPVVATDISGSRDLVIANQTGLIVPAADATALAAAMVAQYQDRTSAHAMATTAREFVDRFTLQRVAEEYGDLYERVAHRREVD